MNRELNWYHNLADRYHFDTNKLDTNYAIKTVLECALEGVGKCNDKAEILLYLITMIDNCNKEIDLEFRELDALKNYDPHPWGEEEDDDITDI